MAVGTNLSLFAARARLKGAALALAGLTCVPFAGVAIVGLAATATPTLAQGRCGDLWYQRNEIYARNGYCFNTERGRATFGRGCFPPYGRLSGGEKRRVAEIQDEENYLGCR